MLVKCNHLAQTRKDILGTRDVVHSLRLHPTFLKCNFYAIIKKKFNVIILFRTDLYTVFYNLMNFIKFFWIEPFIQIPQSDNQ